jgi:hypothetical protein
MVPAMPVITADLPPAIPNEPASVQRYRALRNCSRRQRENIHRISGDGGIATEDLLHIGQEMGIRQDHQGKPALVFGSDAERDLLFDLTLHICRDRHGRTVFIRQLANLGDQATTDDRLILEAHDTSWWGLFKMERIIPGLGAELYSLEDHQRITLHDLNFGLLAEGTQAVMLSRFVTIDGITMTTGLPFMVDQRFAETIGLGDFDRLFDAKTRWPKQGTLERDLLAIQLFTFAAHIQEHDESDMSGRSSVAQSPFVQSKAKIGRNDRCPCGSGRKFKVCCSGKR